MQNFVGMVLVTEQPYTHCDSEVAQKHLQRAGVQGRGPAAAIPEKGF